MYVSGTEKELSTMYLEFNHVWTIDPKGILRSESLI